MHARQFGKRRGPMHVAVAHQDELRIDPLREERVGEGFVELGHGGYYLDYELIWCATSMPDATGFANRSISASLSPPFAKKRLEQRRGFGFGKAAVNFGPVMARRRGEKLHAVIDRAALRIGRAIIE